MTGVIGTVGSLWRYPVKSMRGEELQEISVSSKGVLGDRQFAFSSSENRPDFPYFTARDQRKLLQFTPRIRARQSSPAEAGPIMVDVKTPAGEILAIEDPELLEILRRDLQRHHELKLMRSDRALTDASPISLISLQTVSALSRETASTVDKRRFRANIYLDMPGSDGFAEDALVGHCLRIGDVVISVTKRDIRCVVITLDPDTSLSAPALLKQVAQAHDSGAGVYGEILASGILRTGDKVELLRGAKSGFFPLDE